MGDPRVLSDDEVRALADMGELVGVIEDALRAHAEGRLVAPPRLYVPFGDRGDLAFTVGGELGGGNAAGFRVYDRFRGDSPERSQLVAVFDSVTGAFVGATVGATLGDLRTGALGGAAIRALARPDATRLGVVGTGRQARTQLMAAACVRDLASVRVFGRDAARRERFSAELSEETGVAVEPAESAREAIEGADIVVTATSSGTPVIDPAWVAPGAHVSVVGPKFKGRAEWTPELAERAEHIASDAPDQLRAYGERFLLDGHPAHERLRPLGEIVAAGDAFVRGMDDVTLYVSTGLAGTEVLVAAALLRERGGASSE